MSDQSWVLKGVDAETRQRAVAEAERRGVSLADYLTDVVLQGALLEQMNAASQAAAPEAEAPPAQPENFFVRHRLEALERRLGLSVGGLDGAMHALDTSMFGLAQRVDEAEALSADTADQLDLALADVGVNLNAMRKRLADAEDQAGALGEAHEVMRAEVAVRCENLDHRIDIVADAARAAHTSAAQVAVAHEALKYAVADDFSTLATETTMRLSAGLEEVRAAADQAAEQADAAVAHLIVELRSMREALEDRVAEGVAETRHRMHAAFADAAERLNALSERVGASEQLTFRTAEQLRAQMADIEDGAQTALEETAETLRQAGASLAAEFARATRDNQHALDSIHSDLSSEIADLRERQAGGLARLKQVDAAATSTAQDLATLRDLVSRSQVQAETENRQALAGAQAEWMSRFATLNAKTAHLEDRAAERAAALEADITRVEACTLAALDKLAQDRVQGDTALRGAIEELRHKFDRDANGTDAFESGVLARLKLMDVGLASLNDINRRMDGLEQDARAVQSGLDERVLRLEAGAENTQVEHALASLRGQVAGIAAQLDAARADDSVQQTIEELKSRVAAFAGQAGDAGERVHGVARMLGHLSAQHADAMTQSEERLRKMELALADMRLEQLHEEPAPGADAFAAIEQRMTAMEQRQANAFEALRADIEAFVDDNARRLETLEASAGPAPAIDVAAEFQALRKRIEERVLGVEQRSVRALEQVADTMAVLEKRFNEREETSAAVRSA